MQKKGKSPDSKKPGYESLVNVLEMMSEGFVALDKEMNYTYLNRRGSEILKRKPEELIGKNFWEEYPGDRATSFGQAYLRALETQTPIEIEDYYPPGDAWFENRIYPTADGLSIFFNDITKRKQAEEEIKYISRLPYENPNPVMRLTPDGKVLFANPASQPFFEFWKQHEGQLVSDILQNSLNEAFASGLKQEIEIECGEKVFACTLAPILEAGYINFYANDISEHKRAEKRSREGEQRFAILFQSTPFAMVLSKLPDSLIVEVNEAFLQMFGFTRGEVIGKTELELNIGFDPHREQMIQLLKTQNALHNFEYTTHGKSSELVHLSLNLNRLELNGEPYLLATIEDITGRKKAEMRTRLLARLGEMIRQIADPDELLYAASELIGEHLHVQRSLFVEIDQAHTRGFIRRDYAQGVASIAGEYPLLEYSAETKREMEEGRTVINRDSQLDPRTVAYYEKTYGPSGERAYVAVPLMRDGHRVAALWVSTHTPRDWRAEEVALLETVAERVWLAVEKIRLLAAEQVARQEAELTAKRIAHLQQITATLSNAPTPLQIAQVVVDQGAQALGATSGTVMMLAEDGQTLEILYTSSNQIITRPYHHLPLSAIVPASDAFRSGQPIWIESQQQYLERYPHLAEHITAWGHQTAVAIPMLEKGRTLGVLNLSFAQALACTPKDLEYVQTLAQQCAQALNRVGTEELLSTERELLTRLFETMPVMVSIYNPATNTMRLNTELERLTGWKSEDVTVVSLLEALYPDPEYLQDVLQRMAKAGRGEWVEVRVKTRDGRTLDSLWSNISILNDQKLVTGIALGIDITERKQAEEAIQRSRILAEVTADRIAKLQQITAVLTKALTPPQLAKTVLEQGTLAVGAKAGILVELLKNGQEIHTISAIGYPQAVMPTEPASLSDATPLSDSIRTGHAIWIGSHKEFAEQYPSLAEFRGRLGYEATVALPLAVADKILGSLAFSFVKPQEFKEEEREFFLAVARQCAQGLERARAQEALLNSEEQLRRAAEFDAFRVALTDALRPLSDPLEIQASATRILGVKLIAGRVLYIDIKEDEETIVIKDNNYMVEAPHIVGIFHLSDLGKYASEALRAGRTLIIRDVDEVPDLSPEERMAYAQLRMCALIGVPIIKGGRLVAAMGVLETKVRAWTEAEVALAEEAAERTWTALEYARAEQALRENQQQLQSLNATLEQKVEAQTAEVRILASELTKAEQRERHRIAQILHDDFQQHLYAIQFQMVFLHKQLDIEDEEIQRDFAEVKAHLEEVIAMARNLSIELSPPILRDEGLTQAISWLASQLLADYGLEIELQAEESFAIPDEAKQVLLYSSVRELLFNIVKHAQVNQAIVALERFDDKLRIKVRDHGKGFDPVLALHTVSKMDEDVHRQKSSFGLSTLRHRISLFGGRMDITSAPGAGTEVTIILPVYARTYG